MYLNIIFNIFLCTLERLFSILNSGSRFSRFLVRQVIVLLVKVNTSHLSRHYVYGRKNMDLSVLFSQREKSTDGLFTLSPLNPSLSMIFPSGY